MDEQGTKFDSSGEPPSRLPSTDDTFGVHPSGPSGPRVEHEPLVRGTTIGRYVLLDQLGAGAMGVVYSAYDPELDRKLALKLLHPGSSSREAKATRNRLRREAQALARLTHPNVVSVHDVGTHRGRVFVAMEFVAGKTLRQWLRVDLGAPKPVDAVIEVFVHAGKGLAAAHRAGLVHRDFKPENVLIGEDGTVRVVDFGLARRSEDELGDDSVDVSGTVSMDDWDYEGITHTATRTLDVDLTGTGRVMGTPAYMAPEQHRGETATVRSDQFAFCVALWEALYGERPFPGRDLPSLTLAVTTGALRSPPSDGPFAHRVPAHVYRALLRGLSVDPDARFTKIDDLLEALTHDPNRRRRRVLTIVGANVLGGAIVFGAGIWAAGWFGGDEAGGPASCAAQEKLDGVWDEDRRAAVAQRFAASNAPFAEHSAREVDRRLGAYAAQWSDAWSETCETEGTRGPSAELDLRRECLEGRRRELLAFTAALLETSSEEFAARAEYAVAGAESLSSIALCRDAARLRVDPGRDPAQRERSSELQVRLSEARTLAHLGEPKAGLTRALAVVDDARALSSNRMLVRALLLVAELEQDANDSDLALAHLLEAYTAAERQGEDWLRVETAIALVGMLGFHLPRPSEADVWRVVADSLLLRLGDPGDLRGLWSYEVGSMHMRKSELAAADEALHRSLELLETAYGHDAREIEPVLQRLGTVARERGDYEQAVSYHTRLLERRMAAYGPDHPDVAAAYAGLGNDAYFTGDYQQARDYYKESLRIVGECYGEDSPAYAPKLSNYAAVLERLGELDEAEAIHRKLLAANEARYGASDVRITTSLENLGLVLLSANATEEAVKLFRRSLELRVAHHGDDHTQTATTKLNLGYALFRLGDHAAARALYQQALTTWTEKLGSDHPDLALAFGNIADIDLEEGLLADARTHYTRALELAAAALGEDAADLGYYHTGIARVALAEAKYDEAIEQAERALQLRGDDWLPPGDRAVTQLCLSQALIGRGRADDRSRARDLALLAREDVLRSGDSKRIAEIEAWLATARREDSG